MNITKQKQIHRHRKQTSGYQWGEDWGEGQDRGRGLEVQTTRYKVNTTQEIIQLRRGEKRGQSCESVQLSQTMQRRERGKELDNTRLQI